MLESVYEETLLYELRNKYLVCQKQVEIPVIYEKITLEVGFRADIIVENKVIIELKSVENFKPVHKKQLLTYLKLSKLRVSLKNSNESLKKLLQSPKEWLYFDKA